MKKKIWKMIALLVAIALIVVIFSFANSLVGNPVSKFLAKRGAEKYLEENYPQTDYYLEDLGFTDECLTEIEKMLETPHGLILVTGPTGSGKTTTVNAMTRKLLVNDTKIITIEDPIECTLEGACQIQVNENAGLTFGSILKRVLRQDPNIIVVGEIRDKETARLAAEAIVKAVFKGGCQCGPEVKDQDEKEAKPRGVCKCNEYCECKGPNGESDR